MPMIRTQDSTELFVSDWGDPACPPVVLIHAWGLNGDMWSAQVPALVAAGMRPVTYDQRGYGRSDRAAACNYDLDSLADDLAAIIDTRDLRGAALVGHSLGAHVAIRYLSRHPDHSVRKVVLSAPGAPMLRRSDDNEAGIDETVFESSRSAMAADIGAFVDSTSSADYFGIRPVSPALADWTRRQFVDAPLHVLLETHKTFTRADLRQELTTLQIPTLVLHGSADRSAPLEATGQRTAALIPSCRIVVFDGAGHGLYTSEASRYNEEILGFCGDTVTG
jgi:pimeloyl-ACP methyl ester carboxylesterase